MNLLKRSKYLLLLIIMIVGLKSMFAQNGMYYDNHHAFLIPMLENNIVKGHAYVNLLDKVSKDTNSFILQVFDEYLRDVGEKKFNLDSKYEFKAAIYNGMNIVAKFQKKQEGLRYLVFDQKANIIFDTSMSLKLQKDAEKITEENFKQTPIFSINNQGILDYLNTESGGKKSTTIQCLTNDAKVWQYNYQTSNASNVQLLSADHKFIVNSVYNFQSRKFYNNVNTSILILSAQGAKIAETNLYKNDSISIYPISAEIQKNGIEVISQFTKRAHEYSKIKYGTCIHYLDLNGKIIGEHFNEFTKSLVKDSVVKRYKLLDFSYLYMHKAIKLKNGNWLVAAEQLLRTKLKIKLAKNPYVVFNKKNICLLELDDHADVVKIHVEPNKDDGVRLPRKYYRRPQGGAMVANARDRMDINYFVKDEDETNEKISFVFTDYNYHSRKLSLGNLLYKNGDIKVDRFIVPTFTSLTKIGIWPARFGHAILIKYDPYLGIFDFDNIKFNN